MESLRFLMVSTHYPPAHLGGDARFVEYLSDELVRSGHEVHVLHSPYAYALQGRGMPVLDEVTAGGVRRHTYVPSTGRIDPLLSLVLGRGTESIDRFRNLVRDLAPDVIHWHNTKGFIGRPVRANIGVSLYTAHDYYPVCPRANLMRPHCRMCEDPLLCQLCLLSCGKPPQLWRSLSNRVMKLPDGFVTISPSEFLARRLRRDNFRVDHILRNFVPDRGKAADAKGEVNRLVYLGALETFKGTMTLLEAFHRCRERQGFTLSFFGEGSLKNALRERVSALSLDERVQVHGYVPFDELIGTLQAAAAVVVPSEAYENAPLVALEAMSMGIPVIGASTGGIPEILPQDSGCTLFPPGDVDKLADAITESWNSLSSLPERRRTVRDSYERRLSPRAHLNDYLGIVESSTSRRAP